MHHKPLTFEIITDTEKSIFIYNEQKDGAWVREE